jgi:hypothetical protein
MMASAAISRRILLLRQSSSSRSLSTKAARTGGPIGSDGRHEIWREGIYDHDNEPK